MSLEVSKALGILVALTNSIIVCVNIIRAPRAMYGKNPLIFKISKALIVPSFGFLYVLFSQSYHLSVFSFMFFTWLGDLILIDPSFWATAIGAASFGVGHISLLFYFHIHWSLVPYLSYLLILPGFILHFLHLVPKFHFKEKHEYGVVLYCTLLQIGYISSAARLYEYQISHPSFILCFTGYIFFLVSDYFLIQKELKIDDNPRRIEIMGTYILAQGCILVGCTLGH